jgi:hypothetical protein
MVELIPFIPKGTEGVDDSNYQYALKSWISQLTLLLNASDEDFKQQVDQQQQQLGDFCTKVFSHVLNNNNVDIRLLESLFLIFMRISTMTSLFLKKNSELLCLFALVYAESNSRQVRDFFSRLDSDLQQITAETLENLLQSVTDLPRQLKQSKDNQKELLYRAHVNVRVFCVLFFATLELKQTPLLFENLDATLIAVYQQLNPVLKKNIQQDEALAPLAYLVKQSVVQSYNTWFDLFVFRPLGFISDMVDHQVLVKDHNHGNKDEVIGLFSEKLLEHIESSNLSPCSGFVDAPLIMDWQIEYHIIEKLGYLNKQLFNNDDDRIEFLKLSMEQVRDTNQGTGHWGDTLQRPQLDDIEEVTHHVEEDIEMTSKISQVHDLLPDLGEGFIEACLQANQGDVELVIMQLLEDNLPSSVAGLDKKLERRQKPVAIEKNPVSVVVDNSGHGDDSILSTRRNIYDNDEFDVFANRALDRNKVYAGKKDKGTADSLLQDSSGFTQEQRKTIIQLADMYDDEYDDTYDDINDASGALEGGDDGDNALDVVRAKKEVHVDPGIQNESALVHTFVDNPEVFGRSGSVRKSSKRAELRKQTGMSDEQLEGWAIMFNRNVSCYCYCL